AIEALARALDPGDFARFVEKLGLYKHGDGAPLSVDDIAACAPPTTEGADEVLMLAADGEAGRLAAAFATLAARGGSPTGLTIAAGRHFRTLYAAACAPEGPDAALSRARPPVFGPKRARMAAQARALGPAALEQALRQIMETELMLRSSRPVPGQALVERLFVRLATLKRG
ncbi:MAG TPA: DNA polymerase III subunit delta, partial [Amaricoccus sp.]|nr:DNA polymerase III subunit delta [Amaricoccus sp.]